MGHSQVVCKAVGCSQNPQSTDDGASTDVLPLALDAHEPREFPGLDVCPCPNPLASRLEGLIGRPEATPWVQKGTFWTHSAVSLLKGRGRRSLGTEIETSMESGKHGITEWFRLEGI